jgi:hypothetical protein
LRETCVARPWNCGTCLHRGQRGYSGTVALKHAMNGRRSRITHP